MQPHRRRHRAKPAFLPLRVRTIGFRHDVGGRALEDADAGCIGGDLRHELDGRGAGADHSDPFAHQRDGVIPMRGMEGGNAQGLLPLQHGDGGAAQLPDGADQQVGSEDAAIRGPYGPACLSLIEGRAQHLRPEPDMAAHVQIVGAAFEIGVDFGLGGKGPRPVGIGGEGKGIEVRRDIAGRAGIGVVAPDAAHGVGLFQHDEVLDALALQPRRHADAGKARADDDGGPSAAGATLFLACCRARLRRWPAHHRVCRVDRHAPLRCRSRRPCRTGWNLARQRGRAGQAITLSNGPNMASLGWDRLVWQAP